MLSAFNGVGMAAAGYLSDYYSRTILLAAIFTLRGLAYMLLLFVKDRVGLMCFAALFGLVDYSVVPPVISLVGTHAGEHTVGLGVGILLLVHSFGASAGAVLGGTLFARHGDYDVVLVVCAALCTLAVAASLSICAEPLRRPRGADENGGQAK